MRGGGAWAPPRLARASSGEKAAMSKALLFWRIFSAKTSSSADSESRKAREPAGKRKVPSAQEYLLWSALFAKARHSADSAERLLARFAVKAAEMPKLNNCRKLEL